MTQRAPPGRGLRVRTCVGGRVVACISVWHPRGERRRRNAAARNASAPCTPPRLTGRGDACRRGHAPAPRPLRLTDTARVGQRHYINSTMMMNGITMPKGFKAVVPTQRRYNSPPPVQHSAPQGYAAPEYYAQPPVQQPQVQYPYSAPQGYAAAEYYSQPPVQQPQVQYQYVATGQTPPPMQAPAQYYVPGKSPQPMQQAGGGSAVPVAAAPQYYYTPTAAAPQQQYQYVATGQTPPPMQAPVQYYVPGKSPQPMQQAGGGSAVPVAAAPQYYYTPTAAAPQQQYQYVAAATPQPQAQPAVQYVAVQQPLMYQPTGVQYQYVASATQQPAAAQAAPVASQSPQPMMQNVSSTSAVAKTWASAQPMAQYGSAQPMTQYAMRVAAPGVMDYSSYLNAPTGSSLTAEQCAQLGVPIVMPPSPCAHCFILPEHSVVFALLQLLKGLLCATGHGLGSFLLGPSAATAVRSGTADSSLSGSRSGAC